MQDKQRQNKEDGRWCCRGRWCGEHCPWWAVVHHHRVDQVDVTVRALDVRSHYLTLRRRNRYLMWAIRTLFCRSSCKDYTSQDMGGVNFTPYPGKIFSALWRTCVECVWKNYKKERQQQGGGGTVYRAFWWYHTDLDLASRPPRDKPLFVRVKRNLSSAREDQITSLEGIACDL